MIKRVIRETSPGYFEVRGDSALSAPSIDLGPVSVNDMVGRVIFTIRPPKAKRSHDQSQTKQR